LLWGYDVALFLAAVLGVVGFTIYHSRQERQGVQSEWNARLNSEAGEQALLISNWLRERHADSMLLSDDPAVVHVLTSKISPEASPASKAEQVFHLGGMLERQEEILGYTGIFILDSKGREVFRSARASASNDGSLAAAGLATASHGAATVDIERGTDGGYECIFAAPVGDPKEPGKLLGSILLLQPLERLRTSLDARKDIETRAESELLIRKGATWLSVGPSGIRTQSRLPAGSLGAMVAGALQGRKSMGEFAKGNGKGALAAVQPIPAAPMWCLIREIDRVAAYRDYVHIRNIEWCAAGLGVLFLVGLLTAYRRNLRAKSLHDEMERQHAAAMLRKYSQDIVDNIPAAILVLSRDLRILSVNQWFRDNFHIDPQEAVGQLLHEVMTPEGPPRKISDVLPTAGHSSSVLINLSVGPQNIKWPARVTIRDVPTADGEGCLLMVAEDLTVGERLRANAESSERRLRELVQSLDAIVWEAEPGTLRVSFVSQRAERILGYPLEEWTRDPEFLSHHIHPEDRTKLQAINAAGLGSGSLAEVEYRMLAADGSVVWFNSIPRVVVDESGKPQQVRGIMVDITAHKRSDEALQASEERYRLLFERNLAGVYHTTLDGRILDCNDAFAHMFGYPSREEVIGLRAWDLYPDPEERRTEIQRLQEQRNLMNYEVRLRRKDGSLIWVLENETLIESTEGWPEVIEGTLMEITERKELEEQLRQAQKMEAVGRLAGGVAHDFNNLLTIISGYSQLLMDDHPSDSTLATSAEEIRKAADRAANLTRQLLAFSRRQVMLPRVLDLNSVVLEMEKMLRRLIGEDIELTTKLAVNLDKVMADSGQVEQVIANLVVNGRDALPRGGRISIETMNVDLDGSYARRHTSLKPGPHVMLAVTDNGTGMSEDVQRHIFEPFFTTKEQGKGTGLGLATVYGIVKQSGGFIWVYSEVGSGTCFKIYFPTVRDAQAEALPKMQEEPSLLGTETILVVEDEDGVRSFVTGILRSRGYDVLEANHASEALAVAQSHQGPLHMLLTDVVMPHMSGRELAEYLMQTHSGLKVLYISGYTDDTIVHHGVLTPSSAFLQKPFSGEALARKVRQVLDEGHEPPK
jgi:PAS domain S-box-containing protein